jgi:transcription antitermination factor NusG
MSDPGAGVWYVATTHARKERLAADQLAAQGFRTFCPLMRKTVRHARRETRVLAPVFPGYVFVSLDPDRGRWRSIDGTRGVGALVKDADGPLPVRPAAMRTLLGSVDAQGVLEVEPPLRPGGSGRLKSGPLAGQLGMIESLDGAGRVRLLVTLLGRRTRVAVPVGDVVAVD